MLAGEGGQHGWRSLIRSTFGSAWLQRLRRAVCLGARQRRSLASVAARIREKDFTLRGLVAELAERGLKVDYRAMWNFVQGEKLSFKKNRARQRTGSPRRRAKA